MVEFFATTLPAMLGGVTSVLEFMVSTFPINIAIFATVVGLIVGIIRGFLGGKAKSTRKAR